MVDRCSGIHLLMRWFIESLGRMCRVFCDQAAGDSLTMWERRSLILSGKMIKFAL
jgi:hypothetical protein